MVSIAVDVDEKKVLLGEDKDAEEILNILYRIMLYIRQIKPLGTALLVSMFRFMIVNHALGKSWDESLDLALTSTILPQFESQPYWTLKMMRAVICDEPVNFFNNDKEFGIQNDNYLNDIDSLCIFLKLTGISVSGVRKRLKNNDADLTDEDKEKLNVWHDDLHKPELLHFKNSLTQIINEKTHDFATEFDDLDESTQENAS